MTKEEQKDEIKNRISMALKDPILQQGFEIICKNLAELEKYIQKKKFIIDQLNVQLAEFEKENAELKETCNKWFEHLKNREEELLNELNNQNAKYESQIEELEKENKELNDKLIVWVETAKIRLTNWQKLDNELRKAKEIIKSLMLFAEIDCREYEEAYKKAEQFLNSEAEK